jgi:hypothetical protein
MVKPLGYIIDRGLSPIDGQPYVAILTLKSSNRKTGDMAQVWIMREDINPVVAVSTGEDVSICGDCSHRKNSKGERSCYVNVGQGPNSVWKTYKRGGYIDSTSWDLKRYAEIVGKKRIRWGAYGDPAIIKPGLVMTLSAYSKGHTGYTHQWRKEFASPFKGMFQASCDGFNDYLEATAHGWKTFTVIAKNQSINYAKQCPATMENSKAQCITCKLCDGAKSNIFVTAHGSGAKYVAVA